MRRILALLFMWGVVSAWATAGAAEIAVHPLHIETASAGATANALKQAFEAQLRRALPEGRTDAAVVERFLQRRGGASCWGDEGCISAMAQTTNAQYVLLVSVVRTEPWMVMSARVLSAWGVELRNIPMHVHMPKEGMTEIANFSGGFSELFAKLELRNLQPDLKPPDPPSMSNMRIVSYTTLGVGAAAIATGAVFTALYASSLSEYNKLQVNKDGVISVGDSEVALKHMQRSRDRMRFFIISYSVGAAALATGATLFFLSPEYKYKSAVALMPLPGGGGMLSMSTRF